MDDTDLVAKFHDNVGGLLSDNAAHQLERACWGLEGLAHVSELTTTLAGADPAQG
jgi:hypothetical protein